jgi:hypothetical protein
MENGVDPTVQEAPAPAAKAKSDKPRTKPDPEISALRSVGETLKKLTPEARQRVLAYHTAKAATPSA